MSEIKKIIVSVGDGIGNLVETLPAIKAILGLHSNSDLIIVDTIPNNFIFTEYLFKNHPRVHSIHKGSYNGEADLIYNMPYAKPITSTTIPIGNKPTPEGLDRYLQSEVSLNIMSVLGTCRQIVNEVDEFFPVLDKKVPTYDVVVHNGHSRFNDSIWNVKLIHNFQHVVEYLALNGLSVAVIGSKDEHTGNGIDETGRPIQETVELIRNCRYFISNDTGTYHVAAALRKPGMVMFTATSPVKNHDPVFHSTIEVIRTNVPCFPCQSKGNGYWMSQCDLNHKCQKLLTGELLNAIRLKVKSHK